MKVVRNIPVPIGAPRALYLTFDDGPDPRSTPAVLALLKELAVPATFFVITNQALRERALFLEVASRHAIGNHSLDHRYSNYFTGQRALTDWVRRSEDLLFSALGHSTVGFRSPAGVRTPPLGRALDELGVPNILWARRFFDTRFHWTEARALRSLARTGPGDIILLHDRQPEDRVPEFLQTLRTYVKEARLQGFEFARLDPAVCLTTAKA